MLAVAVERPPRRGHLPGLVGQFDRNGGRPGGEHPRPHVAVKDEAGGGEPERENPRDDNTRWHESPTARTAKTCVMGGPMKRLTHHMVLTSLPVVYFT